MALYRRRIVSGAIVAESEVADIADIAYSDDQC